MDSSLQNFCCEDYSKNVLKRGNVGLREFFSGNFVLLEDTEL